MSGRDVDVAIIGAGHNGLVAAGLLAREGLDVAVFEARDSAGGFCSTVTVGGLEAPLAVSDHGLLRLDLLAPLGLERHGLVWTDADALASLRGCPEAASEGNLTLHSDVDELAQHVGERCGADDERALRQWWRSTAPLVARLEELYRAAPTLRAAGSLMAQPDLVAFCAASLDELLISRFRSEELKTLLAAIALRGSAWGPGAVGTGILLLHQLAGSTSRRLRPARRIAPGLLTESLMAAARSLGAVVELGQGVRSVELEPGSPVATGLALRGGESVGARLVISGLDRCRTLQDLVGVRRLEVRTHRRIRRLRFRGVRSRLIVPCDGVPAGLTADAAPVVVAADREHLERAADAAKWGLCSAPPWLEVAVVRDRGGEASDDVGPSRAGLLTVNAQNAPCQLREGWRRGRSDWRRTVLGELEKAFPDVEASGDEPLLLVPPDWELRLGASGGCEMQGDMNLDQMFLLRGTAQAAGADTEIQGLLLCGGGAHPGGGVTGLPGWHAARRALEVLGC